MVCFLRLNVGGAYCLLCLSAADLLTSSCPLSVGLVSNIHVVKVNLSTYLITGRPIKKWCNGGKAPLITNFNTMWW